MLYVVTACFCVLLEIVLLATQKNTHLLLVACPVAVTSRRGQDGSEHYLNCVL